MPSSPSLIVFAYTGDQKYAGTNNNIHIIFHSDNGKASKPVHLDNGFNDDFEKGHIDSFHVPRDAVVDLDRFAEIEHLEIWKDFTIGALSSDWYVDKIVVENSATNKIFVFPFYRWIKSGCHYHIQHLDTSLPQNDQFPEQRKKELEEKKCLYEYAQKVPNGPVQVKKVPPAEDFTFDYKTLFAKTLIGSALASRITALCTKKFTSIDDMYCIYKTDTFEKPEFVEDWQDDINFGRQRVASLNPNLITVVKEIPEKFPVTDELLGQLLEGKCIQEAIDSKKLFIVDLEILTGSPVRKDLILCKPIALFYLNDKDQLLPVAIQLFQDHGPDNPVFTPNDPPMLWSLVKMWYNNADAAHHEGLTHLGLTHLMMEGFTIATHRNISVSHPVFKLLAPHFLFLISINAGALPALLEEGKSWTDQGMNYGAKGMKWIAAKGFSEWKLEVDGILPENLKARGFDDPNILPGYYFRDDAMMVYNVINKYVKNYVDLYYTHPDMFENDKEIQDWVQELVKEINNGGCGYKGIPGGGVIKNAEELVKILTCIIYTCSVAHAAVNFPQYDEFSFPPNYPLLMRGVPPTSKSAIIKEQDLVNNLPDKATALKNIEIINLLSQKGTNSLSDFEVHYVFDPKALCLVEKFRDDLKEISLKIQERNSQLRRPFEYLDPKFIPNSISI